MCETKRRRRQEEERRVQEVLCRAAGRAGCETRRCSNNVRAGVLDRRWESWNDLKTRDFGIILRREHCKGERYHGCFA